MSLFARTRELEHIIDRLHDKIIEITMVFKDAIDIYLRERRSENYRQISKRLKLSSTIRMCFAWDWKPSLWTKPYPRYAR